MKHSRLDGSHRRIGNRRNFLERVTQVVGKLQGEPLFERQLPQSLHHPILGLRFTGGIDTRLRQRLSVRRKSEILLLPQRLQRGAIGDADDPGGHLRGVPEILRVLPDDHEGVVDDLLDILVAGGEPGQEPGKTPVIAEIKLLERATVARRDGGQQRAVLFLERVHYQGRHGAKRIQFVGLVKRECRKRRGKLPRNAGSALRSIGRERPHYKTTPWRRRSYRHKTGRPIAAPGRNSPPGSNRCIRQRQGRPNKSSPRRRLLPPDGCAAIADSSRSTWPSL